MKRKSPMAAQLEWGNSSFGFIEAVHQWK